MESMKGEAKPILFFDHGGGRVQLVSFPDESWGIVRQGRTICTWECHELADCLRTFLSMAGHSRGGLLNREMLEAFGATNPAQGAWDRAHFN